MRKNPHKIALTLLVRITFWGLKPRFLQLYNRTAFAAVVVDLVLGGDADSWHIILLEVFLCLLLAVAQSKNCMVITIFVLVICKIPVFHSLFLSPRAAGRSARSVLGLEAPFFTKWLSAFLYAYKNQPPNQQQL